LKEAKERNARARPDWTGNIYLGMMITSTSLAAVNIYVYATKKPRKSWTRESMPNEIFGRSVDDEPPQWHSLPLLVKI